MCTGCSWNTFLSCLFGPGWELHGQEPTEGEQGECIVRGQGSPITADRGLEAAGPGRGKQPGNMGKGPWGVAQAPAHFSLSLPRALVNPKSDQLLAIQKWFSSTSKAQGVVGKWEVPPSWKKIQKYMAVLGKLTNFTLQTI